MATIFSIQPNTVSSRVYDDSLGFFAQDNFKLTPRFTLEYGLRYEWNGTPLEGENRYTLFNPASVTLTRVGTNGLAANSEYGQNNNFEPGSDLHGMFLAAARQSSAQATVTW